MRLGCCLAAALCGSFAAASAQAHTEVLKTGAGAVVHWSSPVISVGVDNASAPPNLDRLDILLAMDRAMRAWNHIPADQPELRLAGASARDVSVSFCHGGWRGDRIDLGRTQFTASPLDGRVASATVELNACDHEFTVSPEGATGQYDLQAVLAHELGHVLGLGHSDDRAAVMFPNGQGASRRVPATDDEVAVALIYLGRDRGSAQPVPAAAPFATGRIAGVASSSAASTPAPATPVVDVAPADSVSAVNLKGSNGRALTVYTCEPTLLPPLSDAQPAPKPSVRPLSKRARGGGNDRQP